MAPVGNESTPEVLGYRNSMVLLQSGDIAYNRAVVRVEYLDLRAMRYVNAARGRIHRDVVKIFARTAFCRAKTIFLKQVVTARRPHSHAERTQSKCSKQNHCHATNQTCDTKFRLHVKPPLD